MLSTLPRHLDTKDLSNDANSLNVSVPAAAAAAAFQLSTNFLNAVSIQISIFALKTIQRRDSYLLRAHQQQQHQKQSQAVRERQTKKVHKQQMNLLNYVHFSGHFASQLTCVLSIQMQYIRISSTCYSFICFCFCFCFCA